MRVPTNASNLTYCGNFVGPQLYSPSYNTSFDDVAYNRIFFYREVHLTMLYDTENRLFTGTLCHKIMKYRTIMPYNHDISILKS